MIAEFTGTLTSVIVDLTSGVGSGVVELFNTLFLDSVSGKLTPLAIWVIALLGVSIALGAIAWVSTLIRGRQR